jgi:hypothetical protein
VNRCSCKRGFFTLRDCDNAVSATCARCMRGVCAEHLAPAGGMCVECAAREQESADLEAFPTGAAVRRRTSWYQSRGYAPMWWASPDPYWDTWDYRWYDDDLDQHDDDIGGFGDS